MKDDEAKVELYLCLSGFLIFGQLCFDKLERFLPDKNDYPSLMFASKATAYLQVLYSLVGWRLYF